MAPVRSARLVRRHFSRSTRLLSCGISKPGRAARLFHVCLDPLFYQQLADNMLAISASIDYLVKEGSHGRQVTLEVS